MALPSTDQPIFGACRRVHMVGVGGIGMSSIADVLLTWGLEVSGSDLTPGPIGDALRQRGAAIFEGHHPSQIGEADVVVYTSALDPTTNVETRAAADQGIPVINRADMLAAMTRRKFAVGVAGTHGKTTTTTLAGHVARAADLDPTIIVGGRVPGFQQKNAVAGQGDTVIMEADEFDRTFLKLTPDIAVITNIEWEHVDIYADLDDTRQAFVDFANKVPFYGTTIACVDDEEVRHILPHIDGPTLTYGLHEGADLRAHALGRRGFETTFEVQRQGQSLGSFQIKAPGDHNIQNALAAIAVGLQLQVPLPAIRQGLSDYRGVHRRFYHRGQARGVLVVDDYAHHPTEVEATLQAARQSFADRRLVVAFQPHLYSRTQKFHRQFGQALQGCHRLLIADLYPARETPIDGVDAQLVADAAADQGHPDVTYIPQRKELLDHLIDTCEEGDLLLTMGAGDITTLGADLLARLQSSSPSTP